MSILNKHQMLETIFYYLGLLLVHFLCVLFVFIIFPLSVKSVLCHSVCYNKEDRQFKCVVKKYGVFSPVNTYTSSCKFIKVFLECLCDNIMAEKKEKKSFPYVYKKEFCKLIPMEMQVSLFCLLKRNTSKIVLKQEKKIVQGNVS